MLSHATYDTRLHLAADVCSSVCIQNNIIRSQARLQQLRRKNLRLQASLQRLSEREQSLSAHSRLAENEKYFIKVQRDHLVDSQKSVHSKAQAVIRVLALLETSKGRGLLSRKDLVSLFTVKKSKEGG